MVVIFVTLSVKISFERSLEPNINSIVSENIEALTTTEMPHVKDCVYDPNYDCEALNPIDPTKDEYRTHAKWPSK